MTARKRTTTATVAKDGRTGRRRRNAPRGAWPRGALTDLATAAIEEILSERCAWCFQPLAPEVVELTATCWPVDDFWGGGRHARLFVGDMPRLARINANEPTSGNVTFVLCSPECADELDAAIKAIAKPVVSH